MVRDTCHDILERPNRKEITTLYNPTLTAALSELLADSVPVSQACPSTVDVVQLRQDSAIE